MNLSEVATGQSCIIVKVKGRGAFRKRITEMGFIKWKKVTVIKNAPLKDPIQYNIMGYEVSLRRSESSLIEVVAIDDANENVTSEYNGVLTDDILKTTVKEKGRVINIALVGNPNCGKTTLFNYASKSKERVGNYSGVTVDAKESKFKLHGYTFNIVDLPGTYSLSAYSPEELYVRNYIAQNMPDVVVNVVDSSNLERNLYLTSQLIDMDIKVVLALNMYDELQAKGDQFDYTSLGKMIGIPIIPTVSSKGVGIGELFRRVIKVYEDKDPTVRHIHINYGKCVEKGITRLQEKINTDENFNIIHRFSPRFLAIKLIEKDRDVKRFLSQCPNFKEIREVSDAEIHRIEEHLSDDSETIITDAKYGFIAGALKETYQGSGQTRRKNTDIIDTFMTHKLFGFPIFIFFMWLMFESTFTIGEFPMQWIEAGVEWTSGMFQQFMAEGPLKDLIIDGIIGGVGGVIVFLPNILILFFFISLMEDTGYMARAAFIMDKVMHKIGLHGRSFIPLLMGFGCNVPAIMATRTIENRNNRLLTILINPFMSCSARLPVYVLIISAFFPNRPGTILFSIYIFGILMAALVAIIFKKLIFKSEEVPFVMELPPYRIPTLKATVRHMWNKGVQYLKKMGGVILVASIIIWALGYFPQNIDYSRDYEQEITQVETNLNKKINEAENSEKADSLNRLKQEKINLLQIERISEHQEKSYIGRIGHFIEPVIRPLGFDWKIGVSILTGVAAKEVVVSTMAVLYQVDDENNSRLIEKLREHEHNSGELKGEKVFNPVVAYAFLLFVLIYFPCIAVVAAVNKEAGHWKWAAFMVGYTTTLAWLVAFITYQVGILFI